MPRTPDNGPNKKDAPHPIEQRPRTVNPDLARKIGNQAIKGATKDQKKGK